MRIEMKYTTRPIPSKSPRCRSGQNLQRRQTTQLQAQGFSADTGVVCRWVFQSADLNPTWLVSHHIPDISQHFHQLWFHNFTVFSIRSFRLLSTTFRTYFCSIFNFSIPQSLQYLVSAITSHPY